VTESLKQVGLNFSWSLKGVDSKGVDLVVSDDHKGLVKAVMTHFQGSSWQRCQTHFLRNILEACPKSLQGKLYARIKHIFEAPDMDTARKLLDEVVEEFERLAPKAIERLEAGFEDAMAIMTLPEGIRRRLRTTNAVERLNREIRRRERVIGIFNGEESALRLIGAVLVEIDESWTTGNKYLDMTEYLLQRNKQEEAESMGESKSKVCSLVGLH